MQANGFPVLPGLILNGWTNETEKAVSRFCREMKFSELLVRIEKPGERWTRRRGGYTIPADEAQRQVEELAGGGMLTILLEPASPYQDMFSLTSACDLKSGRVDAEVVGPGFDASDVLRSDLLPHERFEVFFGSPQQKTGALPTFQPKRLHIVGQNDYQASVRHRLQKIGAKLQNPAFPDEVMSATTTDAEWERLAQKARDFLQRSGQTRLLDYADHYEPIPSPLLNLFLAELLRLFKKVRAAKLHWHLLSFASSFLPDNRLVIWDFFPPGQHDTSVLSRL